MALTENVLLLAGSPDVVQAGTDPYVSVEGKLGGKLLVIQREDGKTLADYTLDAVPVWDGMVVAEGQVLMAMQDGSVVCVSTGVRRKNDGLSLRLESDGEPQLR
jgi:hypothetical protein